MEEFLKLHSEADVAMWMAAFNILLVRSNNPAEAAKQADDSVRELKKRVAHLYPPKVSEAMQ